MMRLWCSQCKAETDRIVDGVALCVFCEDGVENPAAVKKTPPRTPPTLPEESKVNNRKAEPGELACQICSNVLRSDNKSGICKACKKSGKAAEPSAAPRKGKAKSIPRAQPERNGNAANLPLTESLVDRLIASFSFERRLEMLRNFLEA